MASLDDKREDFSTLITHTLIQSAHPMSNVFLSFHVRLQRYNSGLKLYENKSHWDEWTVFQDLPTTVG